MGCPEVCKCSYIKKELCTGAFWRDVLSELLATFMLVSVQCSLPLTWGRPGDFSQAMMTGVGMGFIAATMAWSLGDFGGGHMNPAVTFGMLLALKITFFRALFYMIAQCAGAMAGAKFVHAITPDKYRDTLAVTGLGDGVEPWQGYLAETWVTAILVITVFGATNSARKHGNVFMPPIIIGFALAIGIISAFKHTGGSLNPARSLGPAVVMGIWDHHWVYWAGPLSGGLLAALFYVAILDRVDINKIKRSDNYRADEERDPDFKGTRINGMDNEAYVSEEIKM